MSGNDGDDIIKIIKCPAEIMFRHGIAKGKFIGIVCENNDLRVKLLEKFRKANITEVNGVPIEDFVKVDKTI